MAVCGGEPPPSPSIGLGLMSCVKIHPQDHSPVHHHEGKKKGFHPLRGLRRIFRRMHRTSEAKTQPSPVVEARSRSASQLLDQTVNVVHSGLSVSHDSVFCPSQHSVVSSSFPNHQLPQHMSVTAELADVMRRRREQGENSNNIDETDIVNYQMITHSLTTADIPLERTTKDSRISSKHSFNEKNTLLSKDKDDFSIAGSDISPLSHSAARHKMAVRPKRKHAATRHRNQLVPLPVTPEVNEELATSHTSDQDADELTPVIKDIASKSASLPAGVTPVNSWGSSSQEGFFTRLLSRRSGKSKKNVESRQRIQPLTIPASNLPKSQSFRHDVKLPFVCTDTPSLPNIESTCIWIPPENAVPKDDSAECELSPYPEMTSVWVPQSSEEITESSDNNLLISVSVENADSDVILNVPINEEQVGNTDFCSNDCKEKDIAETDIVETLTLQICSLGPLSVDEDQEKPVTLNTDHDFNQLCVDATSTEMAKNDIECYETYAVLKDEVDNHEQVISNAAIENSSDCVPMNLNEGSDIHLEHPIIPNSCPKAEEFKFEIKSMSDEKPHGGISLGDRKFSLSELSSLFEKETENSTKIVTRQKSFSFSKQSTISNDNVSTRQSEVILKVDKQNMDSHKAKQECVRKRSENCESVILPSEIKNQEKKSDSDITKRAQTLSDSDVLLKRRSSREVLKHKEEEPELLKVFARRSLKVKDIEEPVPVKSRDSDKENENSVIERKRIEYQRSISSEDCILSVHNVCRQRSKTLPELSHHKPINIYKEAEALNIEKEETNEEPQFIRIQQRKEVWEKRVQQAMGK